MFIRLGKLADKLVGKTARGKRPFIRWPKDLADLKKACAGIGVGKALIATSLALIGIKMMFGFYFSFDAVVSLALIVGGVGGGFLGAWTEEMDKNGRVKKASETMKPLLGNDPYLDLQLAAFLTVGAMPEWLRKQMLREPDPVEGPGWQKTRLAAEPYTVERAGLDYLDLMSEIELRGKAPCGEFRGEPFPSLDYRLPSSLKDAVVEIILFLSALPDSGEEPDEETMEAVVSTIDSLATIDGESFTEAVRRLRKEEEDKARAEKKAAEDKAKADYNGGIMRTVNATRDALAVKNDDEYKEIQRGMARLVKISEACGRAAGSADAARAAAVSPTR